MGPVVGWYISGVTRDSISPIICLETDLADYYLKTPSLPYLPFMQKINNKAQFAKEVIEYLVESDGTSTYEDLRRHLQVSILSLAFCNRYSQHTLGKVERTFQ